MLKSIEEINNISSYKDYIKNNSLDDFEKYNLFYGWNGSGKSTIARLLRTLETKRLDSIGNEGNFKIKYNLNGDIKILDKFNLKDFKDKIFVFNDEFIQTNIDFGDNLNANTLTFSEDSIKEKRQLEKIDFRLNNKNGLYNELEKISSRKIILEDKLEKTLTKTAKYIKENMTAYGSKNYTSYNKSNLKSLIDYRIDKGKNNLNKFIKDKGITETDRNESISLIKDEIKEELDSFKLLNLIEINYNLDRIDMNLNKKIVNASIEELRNNVEVSDWVKEGLEIHKLYNKNNCLFCNNSLNYERIEELTMHFNQEFKKLYNNILEHRYYIEILISDIKNYRIIESNFYNKFNIEIYKANLKSASKKLINLLEVLDEDLQSKQNKIFDTQFVFKSNIENIKNEVENYNIIINEISKIVDKNNKITQEFDIKKKEHEYKIEIDFIVKYLEDFDYKNNLIELEEKEEKYKKINNEIKKLEYNKAIIKEKLSNTKIGKEKFNTILSNFLGHDHIFLEYNFDNKYYEILRKEDKTLAKNLSEGEKTSIALCYFLIKIQENDNEISESIIVIDDPISSFDSNKVFYAYSVIRNICDNAKQLFILTHNFTFYELVLDWFLKKNKREKESKNEDCMQCKYKKTIKMHSIYKIEYIIESNQKNSYISNAGKVLRNGSEYDHLFYELYKLKDETFSIDRHSSCANISRRLLESFLSFKYPKQRGDLQALFNIAERDLIKEDIGWKIKMDEIYKFVNVYSHNSGIHGISNSSKLQILSGLNVKIINDVLNILKLLDETHYNSLVDWADSELKEKE